MMEYLTYLLAVLAFTTQLVLGDQVLSTFIYTHHGERTPMIWPEDPSLTPLGARQLWQAGVNMRNRYLEPPTFGGTRTYTIREISSIFLENRQINVLTSNDEYATGSAMAFMQGLYPPLTLGQNYTNIQGESDLANGTNIVAPLGGYQYPNIAAASPYDLSSVYVEGTENCPQYTLSMIQYFNSTRYQFFQNTSQAFYDGLREPLLNGVFDDSAVGYFDAYYIWDYLNYAYIHNTTVNRKLSLSDRTRARLYAGYWMFDLYANSTENGDVGPQHVRAIAGRTLAYYIVQSFLKSIQTGGRLNKMNLVFGDYKPMMSFAALAKLMTPRTGAFMNAPLPGSSSMFELFTLQSNSPSTSYPKSTDMYVRFFYQNATDSPFEPVEYALFGRSPSVAQQPMSWAEFVSAMGAIMISDSEDWCRTCGSSSVFCSSQSQTNQAKSSSRHGLQPAVAGVIGAIAALAFIAIVIGLVMVLGGVRLYRQGKRRSELGGFKGNEKLRSDQDLTIPKGGAGVSVHEESRGHERVGSWELREPTKALNTQSGIDTTAFGHRSHGLDHDDTVVDPYAVPVKPRDTF